MPSDDSYVFDASALIRLEELNVPNAKREHVWAGVMRLIEAQRIVTVEYVFEEITKNSEACAERLRYRRRLPFMVRVGSLLTHENAAVISRVTNDFPRMSGVGGPSDKADPWLLVLAYERKLVVVTEEGMAQQKIPAACKTLDLDCVNVLEFVLREDLG